MRFLRQAPKPTEFIRSFVSAMNGDRYFKSLFKFEPRDIWIGVFWEAKDIEYEYAKDFVRSTYRWGMNVYICPLPCCLIRFYVEFGKPKWKRGDMSNFNRGRDETNRVLNAHKPLNMPQDRTEFIERAIAADEGPHP
jgi:hypothetical protein